MHIIAATPTNSSTSPVPHTCGRTATSVTSASSQGTSNPSKFEIEYTLDVVTSLFTEDAGDGRKEGELLLEIRRLRERIKCLEGDNATMHLKLSKSQKDVEDRLTEIELQIDTENHVGGGSVTGAGGKKDSTEAEEEITSAASVSCSINTSGLDEEDDCCEIEEEEDEEKNRESFI